MNRVQMRRLGKQPFAWNEKKVGDGNHTSEGLRNHNEIDPEINKADKNVTSNNDSEVNTCRNSVQGRVLIADDQGMIVFILIHKFEITYLLYLHDIVKNTFI